jgi:hypothetical protein
MRSTGDALGRRELVARPPPRPAGERVARHLLVGELGEAARDQPLQHRRREPQVLQQVRHAGAPAHALQQLVERALLRRPGEDPLAVEQRIDAAGDGDDALRAHRRLGAGRAGEQRRQRRAQRHA